jgi:hypothetical protein
VKEALREYGRTVAIFAAAGLVLSLLVGVLAGNPFTTILLRALLFAVVFGGVGAGLQYVVRRFLPELAGAPAAPTDPADASADAEGKGEGSTIDIVLPEEPMPSEEDAASTAAEPLEELPGTGEAPTSAAAPGGDARPAPADGSAGLDFLPEIGSIDEGAPAPRAVPPRRDRDRTRPSDAARDVLERQDPAQLARGLRTILKRDERP